MSEHVILIGACGWQHPTWDETFYPEGLPEDWQLGYYGNEFRVVLVPASYWQQPDLDVRQWLEETDQSPRFLCEWPQSTEAQQCVRKALMTLGERAIGIVIPLPMHPHDSELLIYKELLASWPLVFDPGPLPTAQYAALQTSLKDALGKDNFSWCWHGEQETATNLQSGALALTRISKVSDAKALRRIIEANLAACVGNRLVVLIVDGDPPDIQLMQNAGIILDLL